MAAHGWVLRVERIVLVFDAAGLGPFAVTGATRTLERGNGWWAAILLGTMSAVGGGVIRDVLARDVPVIFRADRELYAIPAALTARSGDVVLAPPLNGAVPLLGTGPVCLCRCTDTARRRPSYRATGPP